MIILRLFAVSMLIQPLGAKPVLVEGSASPDGKLALYYDHDASRPLNEDYEFYFRNAKSLQPASSQLLPEEPMDLGTPAAIQVSDTSALLSMIGSRLEAARQHVPWNPALTFEVAWSPDSRWVSIEGGAHKFWTACIYHRINGDFHPVLLPDHARFQKFFHDREDVLTSLCSDRGAAAAIKKISARTYDYPDVCWLQNGELAVNAYPYLFRGDFFFVLDARTNPATLTGFCH